MISRTISRVLPIVAVISVGSAYSVDLSKKFDANKATCLAIAFGTALSEDSDAAKAALETAGVFADNYMNGGGGKSNDSFSLALNFGANYGARRAGRCLAANNIKFPRVDAGSTGNQVVRPLTEAVKASVPQLIAAVVVMAVNSAIASPN